MAASLEKICPTRLATILFFWSWEVLILPFIINQCIIRHHLNVLYLSLLLTLVSSGIPHLFCFMFHHSKLLRSILGITDIPALPANKMQERTFAYTFLMWLNTGLDYLAHFGLFRFVVKWAINDAEGNLKSSHLYGNYIYDFFIPFLVIELVYDFIYYWWHYYGHKNEFLWKWVHYKHHEIVYPRYLDVYHMSLIETIFLRVSIIVLHDIFGNSKYKLCTMVMIQHYMVFAEMMGHSGYTVNAEDLLFSRFILSKFDMTINAVHHDYHHQKCGTNYCKRLCIWDRVFGTFVDPKMPDIEHRGKGREFMKKKE